MACNTIIKKIVNTLPEGDRTLHALTSNYDLLFEYACSHAEIAYSNGFFGEIFRKKDWQSIERALLREEKVYHAKKMQIRCQCALQRDPPCARKSDPPLGVMCKDTKWGFNEGGKRGVA